MVAHRWLHSLVFSGDKIFKSFNLFSNWCYCRCLCDSPLHFHDNNTTSNIFEYHKKLKNKTLILTIIFMIFTDIFLTLGLFFFNIQIYSLSIILWLIGFFCFSLGCGSYNVFKNEYKHYRCYKNKSAKRIDKSFFPILEVR